MGFLDELFGNSGGAKKQQKSISSNPGLPNTGSGRASGRVLRVKYKNGQGWSVEGRTAGFGLYGTKKEAVEEARKVYNGKDDYVGVRVHTKDGALQTSRSFGDY